MNNFIVNHNQSSMIGKWKEILYPLWVDNIKIICRSHVFWFDIMICPYKQHVRKKYIIIIECVNTKALLKDTPTEIYCQQIEANQLLWLLHSNVHQTINKSNEKGVSYTSV